MRYFLSILFVYAHLSPNFHRFVILCIYVWIHQVRILVFYTDNYQMCPVPLKHRQTLSLSLSLSLLLMMHYCLVPMALVGSSYSIKHNSQGLICLDYHVVIELFTNY